MCVCFMLHLSTSSPVLLTDILTTGQIACSLYSPDDSKDFSDPGPLSITHIQSKQMSITNILFYLSIFLPFLCICHFMFYH